jgi:single-stranded DNA-binding protein
VIGNHEGDHMHVNVCTVVGRVSKAGPRLTYTESGTPVCSLVVEVDELSGGRIFTTYLPVDITGRYAEQSSVDLEPGDVVQISGKLKYKSTVDKRTQEKTSKLIISTWGIQQRASPQDERTDSGEGDAPSGHEIVDPEGDTAVTPPTKGRPRYSKHLARPYVPN